jgi:la-related protein 1
MNTSAEPNTALSFLRLRYWQAEVPFYDSWDDQLEWDEDFAGGDINRMSSAWSSAATGKAHVSYAERLRLAKESSSSKSIAQDAVKGPARLISLSSPSSKDDGTKADGTVAQNEQAPSSTISERNSVGSSSVQQTSASMSPNPSSTNTAGTSSPAQSSADLPAHTTETSTSAKAAPTAVNVWMQRKKLLVQGSTEQEQASSDEAADKDRENQNEMAPISKKMAWGAVATLNDKASNERTRSGDLTQGMEGVQAEDWPSPVASTSRRRASQPTERPQTADLRPEERQNSVAGQANAEQENGMAGEKEDALERLDVKVLREGSTERQRKDGKQWVSLVPTVIHSRPNTTRPQGANVTRKVKGGGNQPRGTTSPVKASSAPQTPSSRSTESGSPHPTPKKALSPPNGEASQSRLARKYGGSAEGSPSRSRGTRGRGGSSKRNEDGNHDSGIASEHAGAAKLPDRPTPRSLAIPSGEESPNSAAGGISRSTSPRKGTNATEATKQQYQHSPYRRMTSPFLRSDRQWNAARPYGAAYEMPIMESTPVEAVPQGSDSTTEPTSALLWQIEFYFSHQNLQGDFFLRKSMDQHGFVPIDVVSTFNRVVRLTGKDQSDLVKRTLHYSKALQFNDDRSKIRKAYGWQPYVLTNGQHAQDFLPFVPAIAFAGNSVQTSPMTLPIAWRSQTDSPGRHKAAAAEEEEEEAEQSDEPSVGVVSATGLGGMLNSTIAMTAAATIDDDRTASAAPKEG